MTALNPRVLYCDESRTQGGGPFYLGALQCSPRRAEILEAEIRELRIDRRLDRELKWTRVSKRMLPNYTAFADVFLDDRYARFHVMRVDRTPAWYRWGRTAEERFFRTYYAFLRSVMSAYGRYHVFLDALVAKRWRWDSLRWALRQAATRDDYASGKRLVQQLQPLDSRRSNLLQLTDVLLGALSSEATADHKQTLAARVRDRGGERISETLFARGINGS